MTTGRAALFLRGRWPVCKVPDAVTDTMVAGPNCAPAEMLMGLERVDIGLGDTVVIQGAGGLGLYATALAKDRGAVKVIVIHAFTDRLDIARRMGADHVADFASAPKPATASLR